MKWVTAVMVLGTTLFAGETNFLTRLQPLVLTPGCLDHKVFHVELWKPGAHTNFLSFSKADPLVTIHDLPGVNGPAVLVVTSVCSDGDVSMPRALDIVVRRTRPEPPGIESLPISEPEANCRTLVHLQHTRLRLVAERFPAPAPAGSIPAIRLPEPPPMLPNGTNLVYRSERADLRRSQ